MVKGNEIKQTSDKIRQDVFMILNSNDLDNSNYSELNSGFDKNNVCSINGIKYELDHDNYVTVCGAEDYLQYAVIPSSVAINNKLYYVTSVGDFAFADSKELKQVKFDNDIFYIGFRAFYNCINLRSIQIPKTVAVIGNEAFNGCDMNKLEFILEDECLNKTLLTANISTNNIDINKYNHEDCLLFM